MTIKLWLLSLIISTLAPFIVPKCSVHKPVKKPDDNRSYTPGDYLGHKL